MANFCGFLDAIVNRIGRIAMWSNGLLVLVIILQVVLRYVFKNGSVALEELEWHLYAVAIMTGLSYAIVKNMHIRVDLVSSRFPAMLQEIVEILGIVILLFPFLYIVFDHSLDFVHEAWRMNEKSPSPLGLPCRWMIKSMIPFGFGLMVLASASRLIRTIISLKERFHGTK